MAEEKQINETGAVVDNTDYIEAIQTLKQNSVDRSKYEELRAENKRLLQAVVNGQPAEEQVEVAKPDINELRKALTKEQTNLEYVTAALKLREAVIAEGGEDPFVPVGSKYTPTAADYERANRVATVLQEMVDEADGDPQIFLNEYQRRVKK
jgi:hypothetical protein